jgi:hypothetical protein
MRYSFPSRVKGREAYLICPNKLEDAQYGKQSPILKKLAYISVTLGVSR